jgi:hypothetical protein
MWTSLAAMLWLTMVLALFLWLRPQVQSHAQHYGHQHMAMDTEITPAIQAKLAADKKESEFNHHLTGFLLILAGAFILLQLVWKERWPLLRYTWPVCFLLAGTFVLIWSDTELWPFGHRAWLEALRNNREVLQHKTFAALLLALGVVEWQRMGGMVKAMWLGWVFPALAIGGSILLLFHQHEAAMHVPNHMQLMSRIQSEHLSYSMAGMGLGLAKGLAELRTPFQAVFARVWPLLMIVLGLLLMCYRE